MFSPWSQVRITGPRHHLTSSLQIVGDNGELVEGSNILVQTNRPRDNYNGLRSNYMIKEMSLVIVNSYTIGFSIPTHPADNHLVLLTCAR